MASISIPAPGKKIRNPQDRRKWIEIGPCVKPCAHVDCQANREMAATLCGICGEPIGYEKQFYDTCNERGLVHALCGIVEVEKERAKQEKALRRRVSKKGEAAQ
jgi:hypothetical protein